MDALTGPGTEASPAPPTRTAGNGRPGGKKAADSETARQQESHGQGREQGQEHEGATIWQSLWAELLGTAALTLVAAGGEVIAVRSGGQIDHTARAIAPGLLVMAMIYSLGDVSGAHINPAVTLAFALRRDFPWRRVPGYWLAQLVGAVLAAFLLRWLFGRLDQVGMTTPKEGVGVAFAMEIVLTFVLVTVILGTATRAKVVGPHAAIAVGATVALCGLFAGPVSGASMNPARSIGPAVAAGVADHQWIYVLGPGIGAVLADVSARLLHGPAKPDEARQAEGSRSDEQNSGSTGTKDGAEMSSG